VFTTLRKGTHYTAVYKSGRIHHSAGVGKGSLPVKEEFTTLRKTLLPCRRSLPSLGVVHYPAGFDQPRVELITLPEQSNTLGKGLLPQISLPYCAYRVLGGGLRNNR